MSLSFKTIYHSTSKDPFENLALENHLLMNLAPDEKVLLVYINRPCIVMGRFQNPWIESNLTKLNEADVELVRRQSGGGCVYHDEGNINFCFLRGSRDYFKAENNQFIVALLKNLGIESIVNERSDIVLDVASKIYKFSGSAFKQKKDRSFHHCTMLVDSDLKNLNQILDSPLKGLKSKSTPSKPVPVMNLKDLDNNISNEMVINELQNYTKDFKTLDYLGEESLYLNKLRSWGWIYGETPFFECELNLLEGDIRIEIKKGTILVAQTLQPELEPICLALLNQSIQNSTQICEMLGKLKFGEQVIEKLIELKLI